MIMYEISEAFHKQYADMYDKFVRIYLKDGSMRIGLFNDEFYEDISILVSCEVIKITDIEKMEEKARNNRKKIRENSKNWERDFLRKLFSLEKSVVSTQN